MASPKAKEIAPPNPQPLVEAPTTPASLPSPTTPPATSKPLVSVEDLQKLDLRIGTITAAEKVPNADKLLRLEVDFGSEKRQILTAMALFFPPEHFVGKQMAFLLNLPPRTIRGLQSQGMILAADVEGKPFLLIAESKTPDGATLR